MPSSLSLTCCWRLAVGDKLFIATLGPATSPAINSAIEDDSGTQAGTDQAEEKRAGTVVWHLKLLPNQSRQRLPCRSPSRRRLINTRDWQWSKLFQAQPVGRPICLPLRGPLK